MKTWLLLAALLLACSSPDQGALTPVGPVPPELAHVFPDNRVPHVALAFEDGFQTVLNEFVQEGSMDYHAAALSFDDEGLPAVGARIKGKVEAGHGEEEKKYSIKVNFDLFDGAHFHDVDSIHLQNNRPDPSMMREVLAVRVYDAVGVHVSRASFATVELDGQHQGLYTMIEDVDKRFLKFRFGTADGADDGNLYKCVAPGCSLDYRGDKMSDYYVPECEEQGGCGIVLKTNLDDPDKNDYADLASFLDLVNNTPDDELESALPAVFDVDSFLKYMAAAVAISDYEGYLGRHDNFFLYNRPDTGRWIYIPWDHNKSFGGGKCPGSKDLSGGPVMPAWCGGGHRVLAERILAVPAFEQQYRGYLSWILDTVLTRENLKAWIDEADALIRERVKNDPVPMHSYEAYKESLTDHSSTSGDMNLLEFVDQRTAYLLEQL